MKLLFVSTYHYPARPAQFKHGLMMARAYAQTLANNFLYLMWYVKEADILEGIPHQEMNTAALPLRKARLMSLYLFFYLPLFFARHRGWRGKDVVVITQESKIAWILILWRALFSYRVVYECHEPHSPLTDGVVFRKANALIFVTKKSQQEVHARFKTNIPSACIPNAFDPSDFIEARDTDTNTLRKNLSLPKDKTLVGYIGRFHALGEDKGIEIGLSALSRIHDDRVIFCFVGGTEKEIDIYTKRAEELGVEKRVIFVPFMRDGRRLAHYTQAMDVLMYAPPPTKFFMEETSPMKLYEYMGAERPIVLSDFPSLREILDDTSAFFFSPNTPEALAHSIDTVLSDSREAQKRARCASERVRGNTWVRRVKEFLAFIDFSAL